MARPVLAAALALVLLAASPAPSADDARAVVAAFVARLAGAKISDIAIEQRVTLYHPDGRQPQAVGEQRLALKVPQRMRVEQTIEGAREVRLFVGDHTWIRSSDGKVSEGPPDRERDRTRLITPFRRSADDLLAEWRALGVRTDESHRVEVRGRPVTVIGAATAERHGPAVWVDPDYGVIRFIAHEQLPKGPALVDLAFSEHRPVAGGFFFPYRQEVFADGRLILLITVRDVRVNTNLPDALFDPEALERER